jgi:glycosyltransferase involved in cell wall biosynthesis
MKLLQINKLYHPWIGGVEEVVRSIAEGLNNRARVSVLVCQPKGGGIREFVNNVEVFRAGSIGIYSSMPVSFSFPFLLRRLSKDADILHFHLPFPLATLSYLLVRPKGKVVVWWHSDIVRQKNMMRLYKPFLTAFLKKADRIIVGTAEHIESSRFLGAFRDKCEIVPFGIDTGRLRPGRETRAQAAKIREKYGPRIVLFVGRLIYYKGVEYLIRAMKDVNARLLIIGQGNLESRLKSLTAELQLGEKVVFLGNVADEQMPAYYHSCDIFVLPSIAPSETFGIVQLEAMACAKPVINTDLPTGVPQVSRTGETGITVPPADCAALAAAINRLFRDSDFRGTCGQNARKRVEQHFTAARMLEDVYRVYEKVLS